MFASSFRDRYGYYPGISDGSTTGGLPGLIQQVMREQGLQQAPTPGSVAKSERNPEINVSRPGGVLSPLLAIHTAQYQPVFGARNGATSSPLLDANLGGLSRDPIASDASNGAYEEPSLTVLDSVPTSINSEGNVEAPAVQNDNSAPVQLPMSARMEGLRGPHPIFPDPASPAPAPTFPEWWDALRRGLQLFSRASPPAGGRASSPAGGRRGKTDCDERASTEMANCYQRYRDQEYAHFDYYNGCKERVKIRQDVCNRNKGKGKWNEPAEWGLDDEESYLNHGR